jgi:hypothetical protein
MESEKMVKQVGQLALSDIIWRFFCNADRVEVLLLNKLDKGAEEYGKKE